MEEFEGLPADHANGPSATTSWNLKSDRQITRPTQDRVQFDPFWCVVEERTVLQKAWTERRKRDLQVFGIKRPEPCSAVCSCCEG